MARAQTALQVGALMLLSTTAGAQDRVGVTMGYPASVGVLLRVTDGVAIRPELSFGLSSTTTTDTAVAVLPDGHSSGADTSALGVGISGLFYVRKWDALRAYVSPRFVYSRTRTTVTDPVFNPLGLNSDVTARNYSVTGSFGAEYTLGSRFGVFGEVGYGYTRTNQSALTIESNVNATSTRTGIGVVVFF